MRMTMKKCMTPSPQGGTRPHERDHAGGSASMADSTATFMMTQTMIILRRKTILIMTVVETLQAQQHVCRTFETNSTRHWVTCSGVGNMWCQLPAQQQMTCRDSCQCRNMSHVGSVVSTETRDMWGKLSA